MKVTLVAVHLQHYKQLRSGYLFEHSLKTAENQIFRLSEILTRLIIKQKKSWPLKINLSPKISTFLPNLCNLLEDFFMK